LARLIYILARRARTGDLRITSLCADTHLFSPRLLTHKNA
jgi:hypothetical protein